MIISIPAVFFLLFSTLVTYGCALWIKHIDNVQIEEKVDVKKKNNFVKIKMLLQEKAI